MRVSDAQRERTAALLGERCREGYLSVDTFSARIDRVWAAKSDEELRALTLDVPSRNRLLSRLGLRRAEVRPPTVRLTPPADLGAGPLVAGRDPFCDFLIEDDAVSSRHFQLRRDTQGWILTDLGSRNGTRVNGWRVRTVRLHPGDAIAVGNSRFVFEP